MPGFTRVCVAGEGRTISTGQHQGSDRRVALGRRSEGRRQTSPARAARNPRHGLAAWRGLPTSPVRKRLRHSRKLDGKSAGQVGSHIVMTKLGVRVNLSIPQHKELSVGTPPRPYPSCGHDGRRISRCALISAIPQADSAFDGSEKQILGCPQHSPEPQNCAGGRPRDDA
jgi:hypothetical protein